MALPVRRSDLVVYVRGLVLALVPVFVGTVRLVGYALAREGLFSGR